MYPVIISYWRLVCIGFWLYTVRYRNRKNGRFSVLSHKRPSRPKEVFYSFFVIIIYWNFDRYYDLSNDAQGGGKIDNFALSILGLEHTAISRFTQESSRLTPRKRYFLLWNKWSTVIILYIIHQNPKKKKVKLILWSFSWIGGA